MSEPKSLFDRLTPEEQERVRAIVDAVPAETWNLAKEELEAAREEAQKRRGPNLLDPSSWPKDLPVFNPDKHFITIFLHRTEEDAKAFCAELNGERDV
jgi:hypothetical protein